MTRTKLYAGIELGGTKILCRVIDEAARVVTEGRFATSTPAQAVQDVTACLELGGAGRGLAGLGVASFGPIMLDRRAPQYGRLLATPKAGWSGFDLRGALLERYDVPFAIDTDVNAAALAEQAFGAGTGLRCVAYVTVGTGIGGGLATQGGVLHGALHPEVGHFRLRRRAGDDARSACPFHDDCAEGLIAGPALGRRLGASRTLADAPEILALAAHYLGDLAASLVLAWSPERIVFGGGVMSTPGLIAEVGTAMRTSLAGYIGGAATTADFLVAAQLLNSGLEGALIMAKRAACAVHA